MDKRYKVIKEKLNENKDKRVLVLGTLGLNFNWLTGELGVGEVYEKVFNDLFIEKCGYIDTRSISSEDQKRLEDSITITKGTPLFSHKLIPCDLIIFIYVNPEILKILSFQQNISYYQAINLQNTLKKELKEVTCPIININLYPQTLDINKISRNVYICDDKYYDLANKNEIDYMDLDYPFRFPYIKYVSSLKDLKRKQGFLLIINEKYLKTIDYIETDKKYRNTFKNFNLVYVVTKRKLKDGLLHLKYSNIYFVNEDFFDDETLLDIYFDYLLDTKEVKFSKKKQNLLNEINTYLKSKKTVRTTELVEVFHLSPRKVERYLNDINKIYKNIGYDYLKNEWYIIK